MPLAAGSDCAPPAAGSGCAPPAAVPMDSKSQMKMYRPQQISISALNSTPMLPGPTLIVKAPGCQSPVKVSTLASGNTFGAVFWTDGKWEAPMLPDESLLRKHPTEGALFWADECEEVGTIPFDGDLQKAERWKDVPYDEEPSEQDLFSALESGIADTEEKIRYLRIRLWWAGNDPIRESGTGTLTEPHLENLSRLAMLLFENNPEQRLMKAEVFRELGHFEMAQEQLVTDLPAEMQDAAKFVGQLCHAQDARVARFPW